MNLKNTLFKSSWSTRNQIYFPAWNNLWNKGVQTLDTQLCPGSTGLLLLKMEKPRRWAPTYRLESFRHHHHEVTKCLLLIMVFCTTLLLTRELTLWDIKAVGTSSCNSLSLLCLPSPWGLQTAHPEASEQPTVFAPDPSFFVWLELNPRNKLSFSNWFSDVRFYE